MWTRAELKTRAKAKLRNYYGPALLVSFIASMFTSRGSSSAGGAAGGTNVGVNAGVTGDVNLPMEGVEGLEGILSELPGTIESFIDSIDPIAMSIMASVLVVSFAVSLVIAIFVGPVIIIGRNRYYMESRLNGYSVGVQEILWGFKHNYLNIVWTMLVKNLLVLLASCLCFIPGIYLGYCFYMVPFILAENPEMSAGEALKLSKKMMEGQKFSTFVLEISFWGWWILGGMLCGVGGILVQPYYDATFAELYAVLREDYRGRLNGFGYGYEREDYNGPNGGSGGYYQQPYSEYREEKYVDNVSYEYNDDYYRNGGNVDGTQQYSVGDEDARAGKEQTDSGNAESSRSTDHGHYQGKPEWIGYHQQNSPVVQKEVGRGYYLNGMFYEYTEEELKELEENKHKN